MSNNRNVIQNIVSLHNMITIQRKKNMNSEGIERLIKFITELKSVGLIEGIALNGRKGRYFLIDGNSWNNASRSLGRSAAPSLIAWEETDFFDFLKSQFMNEGKSQASRKLAGRDPK